MPSLISCYYLSIHRQAAIGANAPYVLVLRWILIDARLFLALSLSWLSRLAPEDGFIGLTLRISVFANEP